MPTLSITKTYADTEVLDEADLDNIKNGIETFVNTTKLDSDNIQTGGIATSNLATGSVTADKIASDAVTTSKIQNSAVSRVKLASLGQVLSGSCGEFTTSSTSFVTVTNLSASITTTGRPVFMGLVSDGGTISASTETRVGVFDNFNGGAIGGEIRFLRDSTTVASAESRANGDTSTSQFFYQTLPWHVDTVGSGTYTYKFQVRIATGSATADYICYRVKLLLFEL